MCANANIKPPVVLELRQPYHELPEPNQTTPKLLSLNDSYFRMSSDTEYNSTNRSQLISIIKFEEAGWPITYFRREYPRISINQALNNIWSLK